MRSLGPEEDELWAKVAATIRPLSRRKYPEKESVNKPVLRLRARQDEHSSPLAQKSVGDTLDGSWDRRLSRGRAEPDRIIDLHGHSLDSAWHTIERGIAQAIQQGERLILLITGHERKGDPPLERGRIRAVIRDWLAASRHAPAIGAIRNAHRRHGGAGSLYVILRRR